MNTRRQNNPGTRKSAKIQEDWCTALLCLLMALAGFVGCAAPGLSQGQHFPEMAIEDGCCTLVLFLVENVEFYESGGGAINLAENAEYLINRIKLDLGLLAEKYPQVRAAMIDVHQAPASAMDYRIYALPTVILFDQAGNEVRRWLPVDYRHGGGSLQAMGNQIEQLLIRDQPEQGDITPQ